MSHLRDPQRAFPPLGNPFRHMRPKGSSLSPELVTLLGKYEETLAVRLRKLKPTHRGDICSISWMILAMGILSETHLDIKSLITELELPVNDWDAKWINVYLFSSVELLDICNALSSELSRLSQGQLILHCALPNLDGNQQSELLKANSLIESWRQHICTRNPRLVNCFPIIEKLMESLELPQVKNSAKGKVLMQALYGVRVATFFVCNVIVSAYTGSHKTLTDLQVSRTHIWAEAFNDLQEFVNTETRSLVSSGRIALKELEEVDASLKPLQNSVTNIGEKVNKLSTGLDLLGKEVNGFFQVLMSGRDALLGNLRASSSVVHSPKKHRMKEQPVK